MSFFSMPGRMTPPFPAESRGPRWVYGLLAGALVVVFFLTIKAYWVPAHPGVDQNGYLVGGKMFADHYSSVYAPHVPGTNQVDPYAFVGHMWIGADLGTPNERYYPKYPLGLPLLVAGALKIGGPVNGPWLAYWISPACMTLAIGGTFLLVRMVAGSFAGLLGALVVAVSPVTLGLANNPNSHASTLFCVVFGMYFLLDWWRKSAEWKAVLAGLLLGYAATIRYTEAMLVLPVVLVILFNMRWKRGRSYLQAVLLLAAWALPIGLLLLFNLKAFGSLTGYDPTNESTGFRWEYFKDNWETMLRQLNTSGLYLFFPIALAGLAAMFAWHWRMALILVAWVVPNLLIYTFYYWAPDNGIGYLRFFLTAFPAMVMAGFALLSRVRMLVAPPGVLPSRHAAIMPPGSVPPLSAPLKAPALIPPFPTPAGPPEFSFLGVLIRFCGLRANVAPAAAGLLTLLTTALCLPTGLKFLEADQANRMILVDNADQVLAHVPAGSVVFTAERNMNLNLLQHLQFVGDYQLYGGDAFDPQVLRRPKLADRDNTEPQAFQPERREALVKRFEAMAPGELNREKERIMLAALDAGKRVFVLVPGAVNQPMRGLLGRRYGDAQSAVPPSKVLTGKEIMHWSTTPPPPPDQVESENAVVSGRPRPRGAQGGGLLPGLGPGQARGRAPIAGMGPGFVGPRMNMGPMAWQLVEVVRKPAAPAVAAPASRPAKTPAPIAKPFKVSPPTTVPATAPARNDAG